MAMDESCRLIPIEQCGFVNCDEIRLCFNLFAVIVEGLTCYILIIIMSKTIIPITWSQTKKFPILRITEQRNSLRALLQNT